MLNGDVDGYMRGNFQFHFALYEHAGADTLQALVESIWLQFGPFMRMAYGRIGTSKLEDHHHAALDAMRRGDAERVARGASSPTSVRVWDLSATLRLASSSDGSITHA